MRSTRALRHVATGCLLLVIAACSDETTVTAASTDDGGAPAVTKGPPRVLLYTKETEWFHPSTATGTDVMTERGRARGWTVTTTKDSGIFTEKSLEAFDVIVFLNSSGFTMDTVQRDAFASYIAKGHGWVGVHAASHTDYDWGFMKDLVGANFCCHPPMMPANVILQAKTDPIVAHLPAVWNRTDEWYTYDRRPEEVPGVQILLTMDEQSARPDYPGPDISPVLRVGYHAVTWKQQFGATRSFYTGMGHSPETWQDELFVTMMINATEWAGGKGP